MIEVGGGIKTGGETETGMIKIDQSNSDVQPE